MWNEKTLFNELNENVSQIEQKLSLNINDEHQNQ